MSSHGVLSAAKQRRAYYTKVAGAAFLVGAGMELFMIKTGFYEKVTMIEAEERRDRRERMVAQQQQDGENLASTKR